MPLDFITEVDFEQAIAPIPDHLDFEVEFEDTKVHDKRYVVNARTGEYIGIVGDKFNCADHTAFFTGVQDAMTDESLHRAGLEHARARVPGRGGRRASRAAARAAAPTGTGRVSGVRLWRRRVGRRDGDVSHARRS